MPAERIDTLVIGGGQAGLVMSYRLKQRGISHLVLERQRIAERWRSERWDGLKFQFPNWSVRLPDFPFPHADPDAFATTAEIVKFIEAYARFRRTADPLRRRGDAALARRRWRRLHRRDRGRRDRGQTTSWSPPVPISAPLMPDLLRDHPVFQVHASRYRNPGQLPPGAVLVVGAGASGAQIAEELQPRRPPRLSRGRPAHPHAAPLPRTGSDLVVRRAAHDSHDAGAARGPGASIPSITGAYGGHTIDFRRFAADGITLLGRDRGGARRRARDRARSCREPGRRRLVLCHLPRHGGRLCRTARPAICPKIPPPARPLADPPCVTAPLQRLDLAAEGISAVIWATGYGVDFGWIDIPVTGCARRAGSPRRHHRRARPVFPRPAMAVENEFRVPVRRRRRCRRARRPYSPRARLNSRRACRPYPLPRKIGGHVNPFTSGLAPGRGLLAAMDQSRETRHDLRRL